ncbi:MAG TPA: acyl-CoA synthetase FdrA [Burkholderiales bacterium]|nr:acyl-CoA synthetase FdrA [Burkholderiales bacterium]
MPTAAVTRKNFYKDSVALMRISQTVGGREGLAHVSLLMGTPANKDILGEAGLLVAELAGAAPADLMILVEGEQGALAPALEAIEAALAGGEATPPAGTIEIAPRSIAMGQERLPGATLAQVSVPGPYAAAEALKALKRGLHVFLFSDNVPLAEEQAVKRLAARKGLLVMGPDCGTAIIAGVPLGFANAVRRGVIGVVGASGTGMQEVTCRIHQLGEGVSHAIGTGSRDVYEEIGGTTLLAGLELLARDPATRVIVIVSKPPAASVAERALAAVRKSGKPAVVLFLGADLPGGGNVHPVATLEQAAATAVALARGLQPARCVSAAPAGFETAVAKLAPSQKFLRGLYSGGTYCTEAQLVWRGAGIVAWSNAPLDKRLTLPHDAASREHTAIDLGADEFTVGRPHPMIDFAARLERLAREARDPAVAAIVLDVVLGYGAHADPAGALAPAVRAARAAAAKEGRELLVLGFLCGTEEDPQPLSLQTAELAESGMILAAGSTAAAMLAARAAAGK